MHIVAQKIFSSMTSQGYILAILSVSYSKVSQQGPEVTKTPRFRLFRVVFVLISSNQPLATRAIHRR